MPKKYIAEIVISEIETNGGTGRDKDERTEKREIAAVNIRGENLTYLITQASKHLALIPDPDFLNPGRD